MRYGRTIINELLGSYENSGNFSGNSGKRVFLKQSIKLPDCESPDYVELLSELNEMRSKGLIEFSWKIKGHVVDRIWLVLENVETAYKLAGREDKHLALERVKSAIYKTESLIHDGWIRQYLDEVLANIEQNKLNGLWREDEQLVCDVLKALELIYSLNGQSITMRLASVRMYSDSKRFERDIKKHIISIAKKHEPILLEADVDELSEREILTHLGIVKMPEIFEFCGKMKVYFNEGEVDFSPMKNGACISGDCLSEINRVELNGINRVLFIENKTNYSEYCLNSRSDNELVIYHGGLYSHSRGEFFKIIGKAMSDQKVYYWGDIDMGGFNMFCRLKRNIFPTLEPFNMDCACFEKYREKGLARTGEYIQRLLKLKENDNYSLFSPVIDLIAKYGVTVEQEAFLE